MPKFPANEKHFSRLHLVCGGRGSGKTQVCAGLAQLLSLYGEDLAGLISPGVFVEGRKVGIEAYDLRSQQRRRLATLRAAQDAADVMTKDWTFDSSVLAWGDQVLSQAVPCGVLLVDELGPLEFNEGRGWMAGLAALDGRDYRMAVAAIRPDLLENAQTRWPGAVVHTLESIDEVQYVFTELSRAAAEG